MSRSRMTPVLALIALAPFGAAFACGGAEPSPAVAPPTTSSATPATSVEVTNVASSASAPASASAAPAPLPSASAAALATILTTDPAELAAIASSTAGATAAKTQPASGSASTELGKGLAAIALKAAPGMKPEGMLASGTLKEGEHLGWSVTLTPGKCYAVVGFSPSGEIKDLDLHLLSPPFFSMLAGEDTTDDNAPVVGSAPNPMCPVVPVKLPYKVDITAQKGAGRVAVELFSKPN
jgi:hypothetical protein